MKLLAVTELTTDLEALLAGLNDPQREAVTYGEGPQLILAGAGSGKTRVLTHRIAYLIATDAAQPNEILAITFTNKAAGEMRDRAELLVGGRVRSMWVMTFHSACARMLRAEAKRLGYTRQFTIYDQADSRRLIKRCLDDLGIDPKRFTPASIGAQISDAKNKLRDADAYAQMVGSFFEQTVADVYRSYERELHRMNAMDFDDLLVRAVNVLELFPEVRERYANGFRHVLVDEYQDTNHAQYRWLQLLAGERRNLMVVGDDAQSIFSFRGADITNLLEFEETFPDAHVVKLEQNYRSTQTILDAANAVIRNNRGQKPKSLWTDIGQGDPIKIRELDDEHAEARYVTGEIQRMVDEGTSRSEIGDLLPDQSQSRVLEDTLVRAEIAYQVIGGTKFYDRAEIKDAVAYLTVLINPQDAGAFTRIVNSPRRGIGQTTISRLLAYANTTGETVWELAAAPEDVPGLGPAAVKSLRRFMGTMEVLQERARSGVETSVVLREILHETGYLEFLENERTIEAQGRIENLEELVNVAVEYDAGAGDERVAGGVFAADLADRRCRHARRRRGPGDTDDAPQRQGPRISDRVHDRLRGGRVPALARARRGRPGGGAAAVLRRDHPGSAGPVPDLGAITDGVWRPQLRYPQPVRERDPARADRPPEPGAARVRLIPGADDLLGHQWPRPARRSGPGADGLPARRRRRACLIRRGGRNRCRTRRHRGDPVQQRPLGAQAGGRSGSDLQALMATEVRAERPAASPPNQRQPGSEQPGTPGPGTPGRARRLAGARRSRAVSGSRPPSPSPCWR